MTTILLFAGLVLAGPATAAAAPANDAGLSHLSTVAEIDRRCDAAEKAARDEPDRVFADVASQAMADKGKTKWRELRDSSQLGSATPEGAPNTQAQVWHFPDGVWFVRMFFESGSGDWSHFSDDCFRADGSLARLTDTLNTFYAGDGDGGEGDGGVSRVRIKYFSSEGAFLQKKSRLLDLTTHKPVKRGYLDQDDIVYRHLSDVPFFQLLEKPKAKPPAR